MGPMAGPRCMARFTVLGVAVLLFWNVLEISVLGRGG